MIESLAGDLLEEYSSGRSASWFWRQTLTAIVTSFVEEARSHRFVVMRAMITGWVALFVFAWLVGDPLFQWFDTLMEGRPMAPRVYAPMAIGAAGYVVSAWLVAQLYRRQRTATVLAFLGCALLLQLPRLCALIVDALGHPRYLPYLSGHLIGMLISTISIVVGGFVVPVNAPRSRGRASEPS